MTIRAVVADDHDVIRCGIVALLAGSDIEIVGEAADGEEAIQRTQALRPDVLLLDVRMPQVDGLTALEKITREIPATKVVMLSAYDNPTFVARSVALGAVDYLLKEAHQDQLVRTIRSASAGVEPGPESIFARIKRVMLQRDETIEGLPLTRRELQVLRHVALGLSNREIGLSLNISVETVKEHVQNILRKVQATDRTQAAVQAVKQGLV